jgi:hypothetical protein
MTKIRGTTTKANTIRSRERERERAQVRIDFR